MPLNFIEHNGIKYPSHEAIGGASRWIMELAKQYCYGFGLDIGYGKEEWKMPGSEGVDFCVDGDNQHAMNLLDDENDFIFSSHCLEHIKENWYNVLDYWLTKIRTGGIIFLYLPHKSQTYWHPSSNRKHVHSFDGSEIGEYLASLGHKVFVGGCDGNHSFVVICEKTLNSDGEVKETIPGYCIKKLIDYNAGDRFNESEKDLIMSYPYYNDRILFDEDTKPEDSRRYFKIIAINR